MNELSKVLADKTLSLNLRLARSADNGFDWLFRRKSLVKSGHTWFELVYDGDPISVRYYELPDDKEIMLCDGTTLTINRSQYPTPLLLIPPLGVTANTFDLMPERSLVRYMAARGFRVYLLDWGKPTREHAHLGFADYAGDLLGSALDAVRKHANNKDVSMMGWCMGGLLALLHQGMIQDQGVRNLITVASPIDLQSGGLVAVISHLLNTPAQFIRKYTDLRMEAINPRLFHFPGWLTTLTFKMTNPVGSITTYWDLMTHLSDRAFVESHTTTLNYLNNMLLYPGGVLQDVLKAGRDNSLVSGKIQIGERISELDKIKSSLLVFSGSKDTLVPPDVAERIVSIVASTDTEYRQAPGGHMGVMLGGSAQQKVWGAAADWLSVRSN